MSGVPTLILRGTRGGTFAIRRDWTDWSGPLQKCEPTIVDGRLLPALLALAAALRVVAGEPGRRKNHKRG